MPARHIPEPARLPFGGRLALSINETAAALSIDRDTVYRLVHAGKLVLSKIGRRSVIHVDSVLGLLHATVTVPQQRADPVAPARRFSARPTRQPKDAARLKALDPRA
jgi:excisionase family DNA binding protein